MLTMYRPEMKDMAFRQRLLGDEDTMSFNRAWGGTVDFPPEKWKAWYDEWVRGDERDRFYRYLLNDAGDPVGEACWHYDEERAVHIVDIIILALYRNRGYGTRALGLLCEAAKEHGIGALYDDIAIDNPSAALFMRNGFTEEYRTPDYVMLKKEL